MRDDNPRPCPPDPQAIFAVGTLVGGVRRLAGALEEAGRRLHEGDGLTLAERGLLLQLRRGGHQTIPQVAAGRGSTRQYVQQALAPLVERGLVEWLGNPRHSRSRLAALTPAGVDLVRRVLAREGELFARLAGAVPRGALVEAAQAVAALEAQLLAAASEPGPGAAPAEGGHAPPAPTQAAPRAAAARG